MPFFVQSWYTYFVIRDALPHACMMLIIMSPKKGSVLVDLGQPSVYLDMVVTSFIWLSGMKRLLEWWPVASCDFGTVSMVT